MGAAVPGYYDSTRGSTRTRSRSISRDGSCRRSSQSVRRSDTSRRQSSRSSVSRKAKSKDASRRKREMEVLHVARTRQTGVQALRLFITCLQAISLCVVLAVVCYFAIADYAYLSRYFIEYAGTLCTEALLVVIVLSLAYYYGACLRWIFWLSFAATLLVEGVILWIMIDHVNRGTIILECEGTKPDGDRRLCSTVDHLPTDMIFVFLHSFVLVVHALIFLLSFFWRACYAGSMDHLKESERGRRLIKKHSRRSTSRLQSSTSKRPSSTSQRQSVSTRSTRSNLPPGTVNTLKRERDDAACQIVRKDGTKQLAVVSSSRSEIFTHSTKGCKKTTIKDTKVYAERGDGKVVTSKMPKEITHQNIDCTHEKFFMMKGQLYPDLDGHGPQKSNRSIATGTETEKKVVVNGSKDSSKSATESLRPAGRFNSITKMPALESPIAVLNKLEKKRQLDNKSQYAFQN